jgi:G3E family GTPase
MQMTEAMFHAGIANPAPIISTFLLEPNLAQAVRLDGICTVVDAKHVSMHLDRKEINSDEEEVEPEISQENIDRLMEGKEMIEPEGKGGEAAAQIAYADRIVLNKTDLVTDEELRNLEVCSTYSFCSQQLCCLVKSGAS